MLFVNKLKVLTLMTCLVLVGQGFAADCAADYVPPENPVWDGSTKTEPCTKDGFYIIDNAAKLAWYGANYGKGDAVLTADIDLGGHLWIPLAAGKGDKYYGKIFDGQNHIIKNLYVNGDELAAIKNEYAQNLGFVGVLGDGKVLNLVLENVDIQATTNAGTIISNQDSQISVGAVVGWMSDKGTNVVDNCITSGTIKTTGKSQGVGGIVGNAKNGTISNCMSLVEIQTSGSKAYVGGIIGITKTDVTVTSCVYAGPGLTNTGSEGAVGGIAGNVWSGKLDAENSYYEGVFCYDGQEVSGVGKTCKDCDVTDNTHSTSEVNDEEIACALNGKNEDKTCKTEPWSTGSTVLSLNGYGPDGYKITFDANDGAFADGTVAKNKFLAKGLAITADEIGNPSRDQYSFVGWAFTQDATESDDLGFVSQRDTVFAVWEKKIKVTFDANGRTFLDGSEAKDVYVKKGDPITVDGLGSLPFTYCKEYSNTNPSQCLLTEYFTGWMDNAGTTIDFNNHDVLATVDVTYKAIWTDVRTYSVTFHANNNTTVDIVVYVDDGETLTSKPDDPTMEGYVFAGWYDGETVFNFGSEIETSKDLYAHWTPKQYDVIYVLGDGGLNKGDNPVVFTLGEGLLDLNPPTAQNGYAFDGWFYDSDFKQKATAIDRDVVGDKTFYAKFSKKKYRVMYLADNNSYGSTSDIFVEHGSTINLESAGIFRRAGYEQNGWSTTMGGAKGYELGEEYTVVAPVTLYPSWSLATYTITYECDGCVNNPQNPTTYTINDKKDIKYPQSREGYDFGGWYKETNYTTKVTQIAKGSYGNITLYGKWIKVYTLTYELNGGTKANSRTSYTSETETFALGEAEGRDGYSFVGWYDNPDFEGDAVTEVPLGSSGDKTFYAKWTPEVYSIVYHGIEGATFETLNPETYTVEDVFPIVLNSPSKTGFNFFGWNDSEGNLVTKIPAGSTGNIELTAMWGVLDRNYGGVKIYALEGTDDFAAEIDASSMETVEIDHDIPVVRVIYDRKFPIGKYSTIVLPFTIDLSNVHGATFYNFTMKKDANGDWVAERGDVEGSLVANRPYLLEAQTETLTFDGPVTLNTSVNNDVVTENEDGSSWTFKAAYEYHKWTAGDPELGKAYGFSAEEKPGIAVGQFVKAGAGAWIRPMRGYLLYTSAAKRLAKSYRLAAPVTTLELPDVINLIVVDDEPDLPDIVENEPEEEQPTAIGSLNKVMGEVRIIDNWFDMKGRKLNSRPMTKGIYYYKGKQVIVK